MPPDPIVDAIVIDAMDHLSRSADQILELSTGVEARLEASRERWRKAVGRPTLGTRVYHVTYELTGVVRRMDSAANAVIVRWHDSGRVQKVHLDESHLRALTVTGTFSCRMLLDEFDADALIKSKFGPLRRCAARIRKRKAKMKLRVDYFGPMASTVLNKEWDMSQMTKEGFDQMYKQFKNNPIIKLGHGGHGGKSISATLKPMPFNLKEDGKKKSFLSMEGYAGVSKLSNPHYGMVFPQWKTKKEENGSDKTTTDPTGTDPE